MRLLSKLIALFIILPSMVIAGTQIEYNANSANIGAMMMLKTSLKAIDDKNLYLKMLENLEKLKMSENDITRIASYLDSPHTFERHSAILLLGALSQSNNIDGKIYSKWDKSVKDVKPDYIAPDTSKIHLGPEFGDNMSLCHATLAPGKISEAVKHKTVLEKWYVVAGNGEIYLNDGKTVKIVELNPGMSVRINTGTTFQFRSHGPETLNVMILTLPKWPGANESITSVGHWKTSTEALA